MTRQIIPFKSICLSLLLAVCPFSAFAQNELMSPKPVALNTDPVKTIYFKNVVLADTKTVGQPITTTVTGSIKGRLLQEIFSVPAVAPQGVGGVRMILTNEDNGVRTIVGHRITEANGKYDFPDLPAGKYSIDVDPISVPAALRRSGALVSPVGFEASAASRADASAAKQRTIKGVVFIDKDGDGRYKVGKDEPIAGAYISANGRFAVSEPNGSYTLSDLPAGRTGVLVSQPKTNDNIHLVLDLGSGSVTDRVVNVAMTR